MYSKILVPIDLAHADKLEKAIVTAVEVAKDLVSQRQAS